MQHNFPQIRTTPYESPTHPRTLAPVSFSHEVRGFERPRYAGRVEALHLPQIINFIRFQGKHSMQELGAGRSTPVRPTSTRTKAQVPLPRTWLSWRCSAFDGRCFARTADVEIVERARRSKRVPSLRHLRHEQRAAPPRSGTSSGDARRTRVRGRRGWASSRAIQSRSVSRYETRAALRRRHLRVECSGSPAVRGRRKTIRTSVGRLQKMP